MMNKTGFNQTKPISARTYYKKIFMALCGLSIVVISIFLLTGCETKRNITMYLEKPAIITEPSRTQMIKAFQMVGLPVIEKHNQIVIVLSNKKLFQKDSIYLKPDNNRLLSLIAFFMRKYQKVSVEVASYSDPSYAHLAKQQMRYIAQLLWLYGMDARVVHTKYYPGTNLPWECGQLTRCTLIRYHYSPELIPYS